MTESERREFLNERRKGLGASDMAALLGFSPWKTPAALCAEKLGLLKETPMTDEQQWGLWMEPVIAKAFTEKMALQVAKPTRVYVDPECGHIRSNLDYQADTGEPVECKNTSRTSYKLADGTEARWGPTGTDDVPAGYLLQVQTQMAATKAEYGYVAVLIAGSDFRVYKVARSTKIIEHIRTEAERFWKEHVLAKNIPEHDWTHPKTPEFIQMLTRSTPGTRITLPAGDPVHQLVRRHKGLGVIETMAKNARDRTKAEILAMIGDAAEVDFTDGTTLTRKQINRAGHTVKPSSYEEFRVNWKGEPFLLDLAAALPGTPALPAAEEE